MRKQYIEPTFNHLICYAEDVITTSLDTQNGVQGGGSNNEDGYENLSN